MGGERTPSSSSSSTTSKFDSKLRFLKEFLRGGGSRGTSSTSSSNQNKKFGKAKKAVSLYDLMSTGVTDSPCPCPSSPFSQGRNYHHHHQNYLGGGGKSYQYHEEENGDYAVPFEEEFGVKSSSSSTKRNKSISMFRLTSIPSLSFGGGGSGGSPSSPATTATTPDYPSNSNIATRFLYNIRTKFGGGRRKGERGRSHLYHVHSHNKVFDARTSATSSTLDYCNDNRHELELHSQEPRYSGGSGSSRPCCPCDNNSLVDYTSSLRRRKSSVLKSSNSVDNVLEDLDLLSYGPRKLSVTVTAAVVDVAGGGGSNSSRIVITTRHDAEGMTHQNFGEGNQSNSSFPHSDELSSSSGTLPLVPAVNSANSSTTNPRPFKCLTKELDDLLQYGWYWAGLSKEGAEEKLKNQPDGAFVVRDSSSDHYLLSLSFNCNGRTLHTRIEYRNCQFCFYSSDADSFPTVAELIEHCMAYSEVGVFCYSRARRSDHPSYPVRLTKPISRFTEVKSLLYLSRFTIRQYVRVDLIPYLPLPPSLIDYIAEQRYIY